MPTIKQLAFLICHLFISVPYILAINENICPFKDTVELLPQQKLKNGSYLYQEVLITPQKQAVYNYELKFLDERHKVPEHLRGCVCGVKKPCTKLCCEHDEFLSQETEKCEKITKDMKISWKLPIELSKGEIKEVDALKYFTTQIGFPCEQPKAINASVDKWILKEVSYVKHFKFKKM